MDLTFLCSNEEDVILEFVEVEAHTASKTVGESLLFVFSKTLVIVYNKFELDNLFGLKLVLHQLPIGDSTITGDRVKVEVFLGNIIIPFDLPDGVRVLFSPDSRHVNRFIVALESDIKDHHGTVIQTDGEQSWVGRMEVQAHNSRLS